MARITNAATVIYARDQTSLRNIQTACPGKGDLRVAPDLTHLLMPNTTDPRYSESIGCIVPNSRMVEETDVATSEHYWDFLSNATGALAALGLRPVVVLCERSADSIFIEKRRDIFGPNVDVLTGLDPLEAKGIIGNANILIGSRYHALVAALSQAVPVIATGWSHKYDELLREYGASEFKVEPKDKETATVTAIQKLIKHATDDSNRLMIADISAEKKKCAFNMWAEVIQVLADNGQS